MQGQKVSKIELENRSTNFCSPKYEGKSAREEVRRRKCRGRKCRRNNWRIYIPIFVVWSAEV